MSRPAFRIGNRNYVSAGVIPYTIDDKGNYHFLLQRLTNDSRKWTYEDLGGKSQDGDTSIEDVAFRECYEETNFQEQFTPEFLKKQFKDTRSVAYRIPESKYILFFIYVQPDLKDTLDLAKFGTQNNDNQARTLMWISYKSLMEIDNHELHPRLMGSEFKFNLPLIMAWPIINTKIKYF